MLKSIGSITGVMGLLAAILSITFLLQHALNVGLTPTFQLILDYYDWFRSALLSPLMPAARFAAEKVAVFLKLEISLSNHWGDVFVLMTLYLGARAKAYWDIGARQHALIRYIFGTALSFFTAVLAGIWPENSLLAGVGIVFCVAVGLLVFDLIDAAVAALMYRRRDQTLREEFARYLSFSLPTLGVAIASVMLGVVAFFTEALPSEAQLGVSSLLIFALALALYWAWRGWNLAGRVEFRKADETRWTRFRRSSTTRISSLMLTVMLGAVCFFAMNAGHALFSPL